MFWFTHIVLVFKDVLVILNSSSTLFIFYGIVCNQNIQIHSRKCMNVLAHSYIVLVFKGILKITCLSFSWHASKDYGLQGIIKDIEGVREDPDPGHWPPRDKKGHWPPRNKKGH